MAEEHEENVAVLTLSAESVLLYRTPECQGKKPQFLSSQKCLQLCLD